MAVTTQRILRIIHARNGATNIRPGEILNLGGKEICIDHSISGADFFSGACFDIEPDSLVEFSVIGADSPLLRR